MKADPTTRRGILAATMVTGTAAVAGCLSGAEDEDNETSEESSGDPGPPTFGYKTEDLDEIDRFIIESLEWQNEQLAE